MSFSESAKSTELAIRCLMAALSAATIGGLSAAKTSVAFEAATAADVMEWVSFDVTDQVSTVVGERFGVRSTVATAMSVEVMERWVMAEIAGRKEFMESFLLGNLTLGDLEVVVDTSLMDVGMGLTVIGVEVRLRPIRARTEAKFIIIVLRTRSVFEMRVRAIARLEARARTTNLTDAERSGVEVFRAALMAVVLVVSAISSWLDEVINGSVGLIFELALVGNVVGLLVGDVVGLVVRDVVRFVVGLVRLLVRDVMGLVRLANKAVETTEAIA